MCIAGRTEYGLTDVKVEMVLLWEQKNERNSRFDVKFSVKCSFFNEILAKNGPKVAGSHLPGREILILFTLVPVQWSWYCIRARQGHKVTRHVHRRSFVA